VWAFLDRGSTPMGFDKNNSAVVAVTYPAVDKDGGTCKTPNRWGFFINIGTTMSPISQEIRT
jgi:hypothetical protein